MKRTWILICFSILLFLQANSQTATIYSQLVYPNAKNTTNHIRFKINNHSFGEKDTVIQVSINLDALDTCEAIIANDTIRFLTRFKPDHAYDITQGCCCAAFNLEPKNHPNRGTVRFRNSTDRDLVLSVADINIDTVQANETDSTYSHESPMYLFKPCSIILTETSYFSDKYDYQNDNGANERLRKEQSQYILSKSWFHFLHGEKIELIYDDTTRKVKFKLLGYLTDLEYESIRKRR